MEKTTDKPDLQTTCRHLGLADNPFEHSEDASDDHRCYLWMQRDQIDVDHQKGFCLSMRHHDCPWVHISAEPEPTFRQILRQRFAPTITEAGDRIWPTMEDIAVGLAATVKSGLKVAVPWCMKNLSKAIVWLWAELPHLGHALGRGIAFSAHCISGFRQRLGKRPQSKPKASVSRERPVQQASAPVSVPVQGEDFAMLMRLGRECSQAGRRQQAHHCFSQAAELSPASEDAWLWMAATAEDTGQAMSFLEKALAVNPASGRARAQLADVTTPAPRARSGKRNVQTGMTAPALVKTGIASLDAGNEDEAYQLFTTATETDKGSESAWFWRAKTATDLNEVIMCLGHVLDLNPGNEKARASLSWAMERQRSAANRERALPVQESRPIIPSLYSPPKPASRSPLLQVSSTIYMVLGILWLAPVVIPSFGGIIVSIYDGIGILPALKMPFLPSSLVLSDSPFPEFNLLYGLPLLLAMFSFVAMERVWDDRPGASLYLAVVSLASIFAIGIFGSGSTPSAVLSITSTTAGVLALLGRITYRKQKKIRPTKDGTSAMTGLTRTTRA